MSFYTSLTGLNAATTQLGVTSNNIANVSTVSFKKSRTDFGDIFATSPLQKASATIGQGVALKKVTQEFTQGNNISTGNTLDMMIQGDGFFHTVSQDGLQDIYTRNGVFMLNDQYQVVNSAGQKLMAASVDSSGKANLNDQNVLTVPQKTTGMAKQTSQISLGLNLPSDATVITKAFDRTDSTTYNKSTSLTVYDAGGNSYLATIYYAKTQDASSSQPTNKWQTYVYIGDQLVSSSLQQATDSAGSLEYVNKYGQIRSKSDFTTAADQAALMSSFAQKTEKFNLDDLTNTQTSTPAAITGGSVTNLGTGASDGINFANYTALSKSDLLAKQGSSSATYDLNSSVTADSYTISYTGGTTPVSVTTTGTTPPTISDVVSSLNADANFSSKYVAQATTTVNIASPLATSTSDFKDLKLTIGGKSLTVTNITPKSTSLTDIAADLQERLRSTDGGNSNISVSVADNGQDLKITDSAGREISGVQIELSTNATAGGVASGGTVTPADATAKLQITAIDPSVTSASILSALTVKKTVGGVDASSTITSSGTDTLYTRATANYSLAQSATGYSATVGTGTNAPVVTATTNSGLASALNANATFAASYTASWDATSQTLSVTAKDPSVTYDSVSAGLTVNSVSGVSSSTQVLPTERSADLFNVTNAYNGGASLNVYMNGSTTPLTLSTLTDQTLTAVPPTSTDGLVKALNLNPSFSGAGYVATLVNGNLKIMSNNLATPVTASNFSISTTSAAPTAPTVNITQGVSGSSGVTETAAVTFSALAAGQSVTVGGLTFTSNGATTAAQVAGAFANLTDGGSGSSPYGTFSGAMSGYTSGAASSGTVTFTSSTANANVADLTATAQQATYTATATGAGMAISSAYASLQSADDLRNLFQINVDGSTTPVTVGLAYLAGQNITLSGTQVASELTNEINRAYGDEKPFNFYGTTTPTFSLAITDSTTSTTKNLDIDLTGAGDSNHNMRYEDLVAAVQSQIDADPDFAGRVTASYDTSAQQLVFTPTSTTDKMSVLGTSNSVGLTDAITQTTDEDSIGLSLSPSVSTSAYRATSDQRYGINVSYDAVKGGFVFSSGTTGDTSSIAITNIKPNSLATQTSKGLGLTGDASNYTVAQSKVDAVRGVTSTPAVLTGNAMSINADNNFSVDSTNNTFVVSVNGVTGTVTIPAKDNYTIDTFTAALQNGINSLRGTSADGLTPASVNGVKVTYDATKNALVFTTGTASSTSYIKVTGNAKWGVDSLDAQFGSTSTWIKPTQATDASGAAVYIDALGNETTSATGFSTLPEWSPIYLTKGELTFDTSGKLVSPTQGAQLNTVYLPNGKGALTIDVDYSKSTQYATAFSVNTQSQDGAPEGDLVSMSIGEDGLVQASYSNGAEQSLAKIVLANFSNPSGLRQIGDTNYYATSESGAVKYGEAGSAGFGKVSSGSTESSNVDLTQELVDLITEQRNFQANSKAMDTDTQMTKTIIQLQS